MNTLRWLLGLSLALAGGGFVVLSVVAGGLRRSFGASAISPLLIALPLVAMGLLLAGLLFPGNKGLLNLGAIAAFGMIAFCIWQLVTESATVMWVGLAYLLAWLGFYWMAIGRPATGV